MELPRLITPAFLACLGLASFHLPAPAGAEEVQPIEVSALELRVALVEDPDFPALDDGIIARALEAAAGTYAERFQVERPTFKLAARFTLDGFMRRFARKEACEDLFAAAYSGGGKDELLRFRPQALRFFSRWNLEALKAFVPLEERSAIKSTTELWERYVARYLATVASLEGERTPNGTKLIEAGTTPWRSHAAWSCASRVQEDYDILLTNTFILADLLTEPHPHAVFGKAKVGGIAGPNPARQALGGQALVASTFAIDTPIGWLSELAGTPASTSERGDILGAYLLAHEIAHAVFGIPDAFDHPESCLMTSRPGETYREGLRVLHEHGGPCPRCRPYVEARAALDRGRRLLESGEPKAALAELSTAGKLTPKQLHGGYKRRMAMIAGDVSKAYAALGNRERALTFAKNAVELAPDFAEAVAWLQSLKGKKSVPSPRRLSTSTATSSSGPSSARSK